MSIEIKVNDINDLTEDQVFVIEMERLYADVDLYDDKGDSILLEKHPEHC